jgi:hypothetical protein
MTAHFCTLTAVVALLAVGGQGICRAESDRGLWLQPWASNNDPTDVPKQHVEEVTSGQQTYTIVQRGTMDGRNCRSPMSVGMNVEGAFEQTWESNRLVRMENVGESDVINPWLSNGRNTFRTIAEIIATATEPGMSDAEKALAIWFQDCQYHYHGACEGGDSSDPVRVYNVYGFYQCGSNATQLAAQLLEAGLKVAPSAGTLGHTTARTFFDGRWHDLDGDQHAIFLLRDNVTVADDQDLVRDHDLIKRAHTMGILLNDSRQLDQGFAAYYSHEGVLDGQRDGKHGTTMGMVLRPGETLTWRWGHLSPPKIHGSSPGHYPDTICNGLWEYRPDLAKDAWRKGAESVEGVRSTPEGLAAEPGKAGTIVWVMRSPYPFVGGRFEADGTGAKFEFSGEKDKWTDVSNGILDYQLPGQWGPWYEYRLRCTLEGDARLKALHIVNDLQMAPLALPDMGVGENTFTYTDDTQGPRSVRITQEWVERSASRPPLASPGPIEPADGDKTNGTDIVFRWQPAPDPDGDRIADYHFALSARADMRWPLSTNFWRLISRTKDKGKEQYTLSGPGLLTPGTTYYWRVRAKDATGVWGPWSRTWSFTAEGPAYPLDLTLDYDANAHTGVLKWKSNPVGRPAVKYRVYGSDEQGFSVSDEPYAVVVGASKDLKSPFPANFVAETTTTELPVLGAGAGPAANKAYYRVVAVDAQGKRSGPSDFASAPRPVICSDPATAARVGQEYRYQVRAVRSIGELRSRNVNSSYVSSYWDIEHPVYAIASGPAWLKIDPATGVLSGTPDAAGRAEVVVTATTNREVRHLDPGSAGWGVDKLVSTSTERVGTDTQRFTIEVGG